MNTIRLGLSCPGTWGRNIIETTRASQRIKITVCASRTPETAERAAKDFGLKVASSFEELLKEDIEGVIIACPHHLHHRQALAAAKAGKHVLIEKPIANTMAEAREMTAACADAGVVLSVGHSQRRLPGPRTVKRLIDSGKYGRPINATAYAGLMGVSMYGPGHWLLDGKSNPGGSLYMMGVHFTETFQYLMGPIRQVSGFVVRNTADTTIPEIAAGVFEFDGNRLGYLGSHYVAPYNSTTSIYCDKGIFHLEKFGRELFLQEAPFPKIERQVFPMDATPFENPVREEIEEFADCIIGLRKPETGPEEAIAALAAVRGIIISAQEKRPVSIQEIIENY